jgi:hypothetical protein
MSDITLAPRLPLNYALPRDWVESLTYRARVLRRHARRNRYLARVGHSPRRYPWFDVLIVSMGRR